MYVQLFVSCLVSWKSHISTRREVIQLFQLTRHDTNSCTYTMCIYLENKIINSTKKRCVTIFNKNPSFFDECINVTCICLFEIHI